LVHLFNALISFCVSNVLFLKSPVTSCDSK
jgi:hypothetical protein